MRCLYVDLDGTLLGHGGSLLHDGEGAVSLLAARALEACLRAGVEVVAVSARRRAGVEPIARALGHRAWIFEAGSCLVLDGEEHWLTGEWMPGERTIFQQIAASGAPDLLLERYAGRLEVHAPWHHERDVSHLFRGLVDAFEANELLARSGYASLRLIDNGVLAPDPRVQAYHLLPAEASKARAVALHRRARGYAVEDCVAVGDSREDLGMASQVGAFWLVANALERDPSLREALDANVRIAEAAYGPGVYEAVVTTLAER